MTFLLMSFQRKLVNWIEVRMENVYDWSPLSCYIINSDPKWDSKPPQGLDHRGCDQHLPLSGTSQCQRTLKLAKFGEQSPNNNFWAHISTPQGSTLSPLKRCKGIQSDYCTEVKGIFSQVCLEQTLYLCVHSSVKMLEEIHEEGCSSLVF